VCWLAGWLAGKCWERKQGAVILADFRENQEERWRRGRKTGKLLVAFPWRGGIVAAVRLIFQSRNYGL
jgi:hypothetical protein